MNTIKDESTFNQKDSNNEEEVNKDNIGPFYDPYRNNYYSEGFDLYNDRGSNRGRYHKRIDADEIPLPTLHQETAEQVETVEKQEPTEDISEVIEDQPEKEIQEKQHIDTLEDKLANFNVQEEEEYDSFKETTNENEESQNQEFNLINQEINQEVTQKIEPEINEPMESLEEQLKPPEQFEEPSEQFEEPSEQFEQPQQPQFQQMPMNFPMMMPGQTMNSSMGQMPMMNPMMMNQQMMGAQMMGSQMMGTQMMGAQMMQQPTVEGADGTQQQMPVYQYMIPMGYNQMGQQPGGTTEDGKEKPQFMCMQPVYMMYPQGYNASGEGMQSQPQMQPMYIPMMQPFGSQSQVPGQATDQPQDTTQK